MLDHQSPAGENNHNEQIPGNTLAHEPRLTPQTQPKKTPKERLTNAHAVGGNLVFLYSTSLDRAQEVLRAAKVLIDWVLTDPPSWAPKFSKVRDNERLVSIHNGRAVNTAVARPKRIESCRGDAAKCVMVDEVAFVEREWWNSKIARTPRQSLTLTHNRIPRTNIQQL